MHRIASALALALVGCSSRPAAAPDSAKPVAAAPDACPATIDGADAFAAADVEGTFVLRDEATGCTRATDPALAGVSFRPASTFKIPNTLIGLETGVLSGEKHAFHWNGTRYPFESWNHDMDLAEALKVSCVWCFQEVARSVGEARMRDFVHRFGYGNEDISGPIDLFWLEGKLRITPREQVAFLHRLDAGELPVTKEHVALLWKMLEIERVGDATWRGKTGLGDQDGRAHGWLVGVVENGTHRFTYATLVRGRAGRELEAEETRLVPLRKPITRALLVRAGVLPSP